MNKELISFADVLTHLIRDKADEHRHGYMLSEGEEAARYLRKCETLDEIADIIEKAIDSLELQTLEIDKAH